eukprot:m.305896 g.305896  ORF g.305896 m.305896 type:complete len:679 (-) comp16452_c2_seq1:2473-4509(-)
MKNCPAVTVLRTPLLPPANRGRYPASITVRFDVTSAVLYNEKSDYTQYPSYVGANSLQFRNGHWVLGSIANITTSHPDNFPYGTQIWTGPDGSPLEVTIEGVASSIRYSTPSIGSSPSVELADNTVLYSFCVDQETAWLDDLKEGIFEENGNSNVFQVNGVGCYTSTTSSATRTTFTFTKTSTVSSLTSTLTTTSSKTETRSTTDPLVPMSSSSLTTTTTLTSKEKVSGFTTSQPSSGESSIVTNTMTTTTATETTASATSTALPRVGETSDSGSKSVLVVVIIVVLLVLACAALLAWKKLMLNRDSKEKEADKVFNNVPANGFESAAFALKKLDADVQDDVTEKHGNEYVESYLEEIEEDEKKAKYAKAQRTTPQYVESQSHRYASVDYTGIQENAGEEGKYISITDGITTDGTYLSVAGKNDPQYVESQSHKYARIDYHGIEENANTSGKPKYDAGPLPGVDSAYVDFPGAEDTLSSKHGYGRPSETSMGSTNGHYGQPVQSEKGLSDRFHYGKAVPGKASVTSTTSNENGYDVFRGSKASSGYDVLRSNSEVSQVSVSNEFNYGVPIRKKASNPPLTITIPPVSNNPSHPYDMFEVGSRNSVDLDVFRDNGKLSPGYAGFSQPSTPGREGDTLEHTSLSTKKQKEDQMKFGFFEVDSDSGTSKSNSSIVKLQSFV